MIINHVYYKDRQSYENKQGAFRIYFNLVKKSKDSKPTHKNTTQFKCLIDEMKYYKDMEYICTGLNSFERELVIIDCDGTDFGYRTFQILKQYNLIPHAMKVKPNGHSQFFLFIEKYEIGKGWFDKSTGRKKYKEVYYEENYYKWKKLTHLINIICNGDIGFTGYNCQNPFYENGDTTFIRPLDELYTVDFLLDKMEEIAKDPDMANYITETHENFYKNRSVKKNKEKVITKIHFKDEELAILKQIKSNEELKNKLNLIKQNRLLNNEPTDNLEESIAELHTDYINKRIFVLVSQVCKSFKMRNKLHDEDMYEEIINTCIHNWNYQDYADGYTDSQLLGRITYDVNEIIRKDMNDSMEWNKVGYTKIQREHSLKTRRISMTDKRKKVYKLLNNNAKSYSKLSFHKIASLLTEEYKNTYNENISLSTVKNYLYMKFKNNILLLKKYIHKLINRAENNNCYSYNNKLIKDIKKYENDIVECLFILNNRVKLRKLEQF